MKVISLLRRANKFVLSFVNVILQNKFIYTTPNIIHNLHTYINGKVCDPNITRSDHIISILYLFI